MCALLNLVFRHYHPRAAMAPLTKILGEAGARSALGKHGREMDPY